MLSDEFQTLLPVATWANIMGISPWHIGQMDIPARGTCQDEWYEYPWQRDYLSRQEVAQAIAKAELMFFQYTNFWPAPKYLVETLLYPYHTGYLADGYMGRDTDWHRKTIVLSSPRVIKGGVFARSVIAPNVVLAISDEDNDNTLDTFTLSCPTAVTDPAEIAVYLSAADLQGDELDESKRIRPVRVSISGGNVQIRGHIGLIGTPDKRTAMKPVALTTADVVATLDVYRVYTDETSTDATPNQGYALWENVPPYPYTADCLTQDCSQKTSAVCIAERIKATGAVTVSYAVPDAFCCGWYKEPDKVYVQYLAGYPSDNQGGMDSDMANIIAHLACTLLPQSACGCERTARIMDYWREYPVPAGSKAKYLTRLESENPWGMARGAVWAFQRLGNLFSGIGVGV